MHALLRMCFFAKWESSSSCSPFYFIFPGNIFWKVSALVNLVYKVLVKSVPCSKFSIQSSDREESPKLIFCLDATSFFFLICLPVHKELPYPSDREESPKLTSGVKRPPAIVPPSSPSHFLDLCVFVCVCVCVCVCLSVSLFEHTHTHTYTHTHTGPGAEGRRGRRERGQVEREDGLDRNFQNSAP